MIHFACPSCRTAYKVGDEFAGRTTKCRQCGQPLQVPAVATSALVPIQVVVPQPAPPTSQHPPAGVNGGQLVRSAAAVPVKVLEPVTIKEQNVDCPLCAQAMRCSEAHLTEWLECARCRGELIVLACERTWRVFPRSPKQYHVKASARLLHWPSQCACCFGAADTTARISHVRYKGSKAEERAWEVPYCQGCLDHGLAMENAQRFPEPSRAKRILADIGLKLKSNCVGLMTAAGYDGWNGSVQYFRFLSERYTLAFIEANRSKIVM